MTCVRGSIVGLVLALALVAPWPAHAQVTELVDPTALRVCADPNNLPYSNQAGEGFENAIAEMLAADLGLPLEYTWYPNTVGFVRNTLGAHLCDVVIGVVQGSELMQNTNPYYRSSYVMVSRADEGVKPESLDDPALRDLKIGIIARTPPVDLLARRGLLGNIETYHLMVDTRYYSPARDLVVDVAEGEVDVGLVWGPIAGYWAARQKTPLRLVPLAADQGSRIRLDYRISMGLRHDEPDWKHRLNDFLASHEKQIETLLLEYGVPLIGRDGELIRADAAPG
ncbi:MAG TPA: substrate-binding domain-containing protein [Geminicoccaceae bacterium]